MTKPAETIDQVIDQLTEIIDWSRATGSRLGYFAALYRQVTIKVKEGIAENFFDDGERMQRLDVIFANRYLAAVEAHRDNAQPSRCWQYSFQVAKQRWPIALQHLLLGMNAHINLDLGIAAARTAPADALPSLHDDFNRINEILTELVGDVLDDLAQIWSALRLFNRYLGTVETGIINFSMKKARNQAWSVAERLAPLTESAQTGEIAKLDAEVAAFARVIRHPGVVGSTVTGLVRLGERGSIPRKIDILT